MSGSLVAAKGGALAMGMNSVSSSGMPARWYGAARRSHQRANGSRRRSAATSRREITRDSPPESAA
jgi:hypothetical protein